MNTGSKIYVSGHRGLLGSAIVRRLRAEGFHNLVLRTSQELDLRDQRIVYEFLNRERPEYVFECAAKVGGIKANIDHPAEFLFNNLAIQLNLIHGAWLAGVQKLLFVGSSCIYPRLAPSPICESALMTGPLEPTNEGYAVAKIAGIRMCQLYRTQYGCNYICAVPTNLFGINDHYDLQTSHLLPALILKIHTAKMRGEEEVVIWGSGKARREFMLSDDCADALVYMMKHYNGIEPLNVGTGIDATVMELAETVARVLNAYVSFRLDPTKPDGMMRKLVDVSLLRKLGWVSQIGLEQGVHIAYQDFLEKCTDSIRT
jgi:GDP-L-fucose synthase